jgi:hypothetical protein
MGLPGPALPTSSLAAVLAAVLAVLAAVLAVALVSQAAAIKCYQAPKSWPACWTDPNGEYAFTVQRALCGAVSPSRTNGGVLAGQPTWFYSQKFRGDSRFQVMCVRTPLSKACVGGRVCADGRGLTGGLLSPSK